MPRPLSLFTSYSAKENQVTNYCGVILKILYERSPSAFDEAVVQLTAGDVQISTKVAFSQQERGSRSVPDLVIRQESFSLFFETKLHDWHYSEQINRHITGMAPGEEKRVLFLLANFEEEDATARFESEIRSALDHGVTLIPCSFSQFVEALERADTQRLISRELEEFRDYLDREKLLSTWKETLDVVSCRQTLNEIDDGVYMCPDTGGAYSHRRARFFGPYANKKVSTIFEVDGVVSVAATNDDEELMADVRFNNKNLDLQSLKQRAIEKVRKWRSTEVRNYSIQTFLLSNPAPTSFIKDSSGGMFGSKIYFYRFNGADTSKKVAEILKDKKWSEWSC